MDKPINTRGQRFVDERVDVLVLGCGMAGIMAALAARERGAEVVLACSGELGVSGDSTIASGGLAIGANTSSGDGPEAHFEDTLRSGVGLCTSEVVRAVVEGAPQILDLLVRYGGHFARSEDGSLAFQRVPGHRNPRSVRCLGGGTGALMKPLIARLADQGISVRERVRAVRLLKTQPTDKEELGIAGAQLVSEQDGGLTVVAAGATVLATGGLGQLYAHTSNNPDIVGSGYALALQAGCSVADLEFVQFTPTALVYPEFAAGMSPGGALMAQPGVTLRNTEGERFMERYDPVHLENTTRDVLSRSIHQEIAEGRGTAHDGVFLDLSGTSRAAIADISGRFLRAMDDGGFDPFQTMVEISPETHFCMGGVPIDGEGRTELAGLYAAGEASAGTHGANRLNSNALTEAAVMGRTAGLNAAAYADSWGRPEVISTPGRPDDLDWGEWDGAACAEPDPASQTACRSDEFFQISNDIKRVVQSSAGVVRNQTGLSQGIKHLEELELQASRRAPRSLQDYLASMTLRQMCVVGRALMLCALERQESRGSHFRDDFRESSPAEPVHKVVRWENGLHVRTVAGGGLADLVRRTPSGRGRSAPRLTRESEERT